MDLDKAYITIKFDNILNVLTIINSIKNSTKNDIDIIRITILFSNLNSLFIINIDIKTDIELIADTKKQLINILLFTPTIKHIMNVIMKLINAPVDR